MNRITPKPASLLASMIVTLTLLISSSPTIAQTTNEKPTPGAMIADALVARPLLLATSILSTGLYVISLPVSLPGGNAKGAAQSLVVEPWKNTVFRCLGCQHTRR